MDNTSFSGPSTGRTKSGCIGSAAVLMNLLLVGQVRAQTSEAARPNPGSAQQAEISLALSACPAAVAKDAGVYVLGKAGYEKTRDSRNGFTAIVQHSAADAQEPRCMDSEGTRTVLPRLLMATELRARGKGRDEIQASLAEAFAKGQLKPPARPGMEYMLSDQIETPNARGAVTHFPPHVMFYAPYLTNADIGVDKDRLGPDGNPIGPAFVVLEGTPYALIIVPIDPNRSQLNKSTPADALREKPHSHE